MKHDIQNGEFILTILRIKIFNKLFKMRNMYIIELIKNKSLLKKGDQCKE